MRCYTGNYGPPEIGKCALPPPLVANGKELSITAFWENGMAVVWRLFMGIWQTLGHFLEYRRDCFFSGLHACELQYTSIAIEKIKSGEKRRFGEDGASKVFRKYDSKSNTNGSAPLHFAKSLYWYGEISSALSVWAWLLCTFQLVRAHTGTCTSLAKH